MKCRLVSSSLMLGVLACANTTPPTAGETGTGSESSTEGGAEPMACEAREPVVPTSDFFTDISDSVR